MFSLILAIIKDVYFCLFISKLYWRVKPVGQTLPCHQNKTTLIGKKELKLSLLTDDLILYGEIPKKRQTSFVMYAGKGAYRLSVSAHTQLYALGKQPVSTPISETLVNRDPSEATLPGQHCRRRRRHFVSPARPHSPLLGKQADQQHKCPVSVWRSKCPGLEGVPQRVGGGGRGEKHCARRSSIFTDPSI